MEWKESVRREEPDWPPNNETKQIAWSDVNTLISYALKCSTIILF